MSGGPVMDWLSRKPLLLLLPGRVIATACRQSRTPAPETGPVALGAADAGGGVEVARGAVTPDGAALYARYCALCHGADGSGYAADNALLAYLRLQHEAAARPRTGSNDLL